MATSLDRIAALTAEIEALKKSAITELMERRNSLSQQLAAVDQEIGELTGRAPEPKRRGRKPGSSNSTPPRSLPLQELKELLTGLPNKTANIRKDNLDLANIKTLATANPHLLKMGGKGAWPTVTLLK
jgi:flagellar biosynthesis/type III secretory pathway chaperone